MSRGHAFKMFGLSVEIIESDGLVPPTQYIGQKVGSMSDTGQMAHFGHGSLLHLKAERGVKALKRAEFGHLVLLQIGVIHSLGFLQRMAFLTLVLVALKTKGHGVLEAVVDLGGVHGEGDLKAEVWMSR